MITEQPDFYKYIDVLDIHYLDYQTFITMDIGLRRLEKLDNYLSSLNPTPDPLKIIMDGRDFSYDSEDTHLSMARKGRELLLNKFTNVFLAIINDYYESEISVNEAWFKSKEKATEWLKAKS